MRCNQTKCKKNINGTCKKPNPERTLQGTCLEYEPDECIFNVAGKGKCCEKTAPNSEYCLEHKNAKCVVCGGQAVKHCLWKVDDEDGLCGTNLCNDRDCFKQHKKEAHEEKPIEIPVPKKEAEDDQSNPS